MLQLIHRAIVFFASLLIVTNIYAQYPFEGGISIGATATQVDGDGYGGYNKSGIHCGTWICRQFAHNLAYLVEISYHTKGSKSSITAETEQLDYYKLSLHYIEIPVTIRYYHKHYIFDLGLGPAYLAKEHEEGYLGGFYQTRKNTGFNKFDYVVSAAFGLKINEMWNIKARISYSMFDAARTYLSPRYTPFRWQYNNDISVILYRKIGNNKK